MLSKGCKNWQDNHLFESFCNNNINCTYTDVKEGKPKIQSIFASLIRVLICCGVSKSFDAERESRTSRTKQRKYGSDILMEKRR